MFNSHHGHSLSLTDLAGSFGASHGVSISKQGIDDRFNEQAVCFLNKMLASVLSNIIIDKEKLVNSSSVFSSCLLRDSTRFSLPDNCAEVYQGHGGVGTKSMISIQYELDLLSGGQIDLQLTSGRRNDQADSRQSSKEISAGSLLIRDLGYVTSTYLQSVIDQQAYFLNRLPSQRAVYNLEQQGAQIDFHKVYKKMNRHNLQYLSFNVEVGKKSRIPCRLVVYRTDQSTYRKRIRKTTKNSNSLGFQVTAEQKIRSKLDLFITNTSAQIIQAKNVKSIYSLRWQIELIFKTWKSVCNLDKIKQMKKHRVECMLLAGLIWIVTNWKIFQIINQWFDLSKCKKASSAWKYFKYATNNHRNIRAILNQKENQINRWLDKLISLAERQFFKEKRTNRRNYLDQLKLILNS